MVLLTTLLILLLQIFYCAIIQANDKSNSLPKSADSLSKSADSLPKSADSISKSADSSLSSSLAVSPCSKIEETLVQLNQNACRCFDIPDYDDLNMQMNMGNMNTNMSNTNLHTKYENNSRIWIGCTQKFMPSVYRDLESLPDEVQLAKLWIWNNKIFVLPEGFFKKVRTEKLIFEHNKLGSISAESLAPTAPYLVHLILRNNHIQEINMVIFKNLSKLRTLDFSGNLISNLDSNSIGEIQTLNFLSFENNHIQNLTGSIFKLLPNLEHLNLAFNKILALDDPSVFEGLLKLEVLNLENNQIESIGQNLFGNLPNLRILNLGSNKLKSLALSGPLSNLKQLYLNNNQFETINDYGDFNIFDNESKNLHIETNLHNLELLNMDNNRLTSLNYYWAKNILSLKVLSMANNQISNLDSKSLNGLSKLSILVLSNNKIQKIPPNFFDYNLKNLMQILLSQNLLTNLTEKMFNQLENLSIINLAYNQLISIDTNAFWRLPKLQRLYLNKNLLENLHIDSFSINAPNLNSINLADNPWLCECGIVNLSQWIHSHSKSIIGLSNTLCRFENDSIIVPNFVLAKFWQTADGQKCIDEEKRRRIDDVINGQSDKNFEIQINSPLITILAMILGISTILILFAILLLYLQDGEKQKKSWKDEKITNYLRRVPSDMVKLIPPQGFGPTNEK